jgi:hypothetical protein
MAKRNGGHDDLETVRDPISTLTRFSDPTSPSPTRGCHRSTGRPRREAPLGVGYDRIDNSGRATLRYVTRLHNSDLDTVYSGAAFRQRPESVAVMQPPGMRAHTPV